MILLSNGHAHDDDGDDDLPSVGAAAVGISPGQGLDTLLDSTQAGRWLEMKLRTVENKFDVIMLCHPILWSRNHLCQCKAWQEQDQTQLHYQLLQESEKDHQDRQL